MKNEIKEQVENQEVELRIELEEMQKLGVFESVEKFKEYFEEKKKQNFDNIAESYNKIFFGMNAYEFNKIYHASEMKREDKRKFGYVYFLLNKKNGYIKIGKAMKIKERLQTFNREYKGLTGDDADFELIALLYSHKSVLGKLEKEMHTTFKSYRIHGEWFRMNANDMEYFFEGYETTRVNNVIVCYRDFHDEHLYKKIEKITGVTGEEIDKLYEEIENYENSFFSRKPEIAIIRNSLENKCGFYTRRYDFEIDSLVTASYGNAEEEFYDINDIKKMNINLNEIEKAITILKEKTSYVRAIFNHNDNLDEMTQVLKEAE